jgi:isoamylase
LLDRHGDVQRFVTLLNQRWPMRDERHEPSTLCQLLREARRTWHGVRLNQPDWSDDSHGLAITAEIPRAAVRFHMILNAYWEPLDFELPPSASWRRRLDTSLDSPQDIVDWSVAPAVPGDAYSAQARSVVVLFASM